MKRAKRRNSFQHGRPFVGAMNLLHHPDSDRLAQGIARCIPLAGSWAGEAFRATALAFATRRDLASGDGARKHGGRWNPKGGFRTFYGALSAEAALMELLEGRRRKGLPDIQALPVALAGFHVSLQQVLDITDGVVRRQLGVSLRRMITEPWEQLQRGGREALTQAIGRLAQATGLEGLLVPSAVARTKHRNLVVFPDRLLPNSKITIVRPGQFNSHRRKTT
jgi:RES domain-containing protein